MELCHWYLKVSTNTSHAEFLRLSHLCIMINPSAFDRFRKQYSLNGKLCSSRSECFFMLLKDQTNLGLICMKMHSDHDLPIIQFLIFPRMGLVLQRGCSDKWCILVQIISIHVLPIAWLVLSFFYIFDRQSSPSPWGLKADEAIFTGGISVKIFCLLCWQRLPQLPPQRNDLLHRD